MNNNHILIETSYEFKRSRRSVIFWLFVVLGILGIALYMFTPLSALTSVESLNQLLKGPSMKWVAQVLPSSIPFRCAYLFNILQLFFVTVLVINDMRLSRVDTLAALKVHPQGNTESSIGSIAGKVFVFSIVNVVTFLFCALLNFLFYPKVFNIGYYLFYWLTLNLPTLFFCLGLSTLVVRMLKNNGLSIVVLVLILGMFTLPGSVWLNGVFDPLATRIPNLFSDFMGHVNLDAYLLQRVFILFFGIGLAVLAVIPYPRIHNNTRAAYWLTGAALIPLLLAGSFAGIYIYDFQSVSGKREAYREVYSKYTSSNILKITENQLQVKEAKHGGISATSRMTVENREVEALPLVFYLNPGLEVSSVTVNGEPITFCREKQVLLVEGKVAPGEKKEVVVNYEGKIDNRLCFLDIPEEKYTSSTLNTIDMYRFGYAPAFCEKEYKLLPPECAWYPVSVPPYDSLGFRRAMFTRYTLDVEHDPRLVAICQGEANRETAGKTIFTFEHNMKGISLCVGNYKKREIMVDNYVPSVTIIDRNWNELEKDTKPVKLSPMRFELFYLPEHEFMLDDYDQYPVDELRDLIGSTWSAMGFDGDDIFAKDIGFDPTIRYPYNWVTLVEVPCNFHAFTGKTSQTGERVQEGMLFLPEKKYSERVRSSYYSAEARLMEELALFDRGSYALNNLCKGITSFVYSDDIPLANDVLRVAFCRNLNTEIINGSKEFYVIDYLKDHSLEEALSDPSLSQELLNYIIIKKCEWFKAFLTLLIGEKEFEEAYHDFLKRHVFEEATFEDFSREIFDRYHVRLDSMIVSWYRCNELPVFEIEGNVTEITNVERPDDYMYDFKVFNRGKVPGIVNIHTPIRTLGWIIPAGEGRAIRQQTPSNSISNIRTPLALNVPGEFELSSKTIDGSLGVNIDTTSSFLPLDATFAFAKKNKDDIIVDNNDSGFSIQETRKFNIASFLGKVETRAKCYGIVPNDHWGMMVTNGCLGFPVKGAYFKRGGKGNQKVQWETDLPEGTYEVFCHIPFDENSKTRFEGELDYYFKREYHYTVFDGREEHEVLLTLGKEDWNWISLGVFNFQGKGRVTLSDQDRNGDLFTGDAYIYVPQEVVADAMKWVRRDL